MKTGYIFIILTLAYTSSIFAQEAQPNLAQYDDAVFKSKSNDDKENFGGYFNALVNLVSEDSTSTFTMQPTVYALMKIFDSARYSLDSRYYKERFERNLQINLGLTPQATSFNNLVKSFQVGLTYAILNNKDITREDYRDIEKTKTYLTSVDAKNQILEYEIAPDHASQREDIGYYLSDPTNKEYISKLSPEFKAFLKKQVKIADPSKLALPEQSYQTLADALKKKPLWTITCNSFYDDLKYRWKDLDFSSNFSYYPVKSSQKYFEQLSLNAKADYSILNDTLIESKNLQRQTGNFSIDANFPIKIKIKHAYRKVLEIKPGGSYSYLFSGMYKGEEQFVVDAKMTFRFIISQNINIPVSIVYDTKHPEFFGFLSVQYSFK